MLRNRRGRWASSERGWRGASGARYSSAPVSRSVTAFMWLVLLAVLVGIVIGLILPKINQNVGNVTGEYVAIGEAAQKLSQLKVGQSHASGYNRSVLAIEPPTKIKTDAMLEKTCLRAI